MKKYFLSAVLILVSGIFSSLLMAERSENEPKLDLKPLEARAEKNDPEAQAALGIFFIAGREVEKDEKKGFEWLEKAASQNDPRGLYYFSLCFLDGLGTEKNEVRGLQILQKAVEADYIPAKTFFGKSLLKGQYGQKKDVPRALEILTEAAGQEDAEAQYILGILYSGAEKEVKKNRQRQMKWLTLSAMHGFAPAQRVLGIEYWNTGDQFWSREWLEDAAENGDAESSYLLGTHALKGLHGESDPDVAISHFQDAAEKGFAPAQLLLGGTLLNLEQELPAAVWLQKAALQGNEDAKKELEKHFFDPVVCLDMGIVCMFGKDGLYSLPEARRWFERGDAIPHTFGLLAQMYLSGIGGPKDVKKGLELLEKGAKMDDFQCVNQLAWLVLTEADGPFNPEKLHALLNSEKCSDTSAILTLKALSLYFGLGVERDTAGADRLFRQAAKEDSFAQEWLAFTTVFPIPEGVTTQKDVYAFIQKTAEETKNAHALCLLGLAAKHGWQCEQNDQRAFEFFTQAAEIGCAPAEYELFLACQLGLGTPADPKKAEVWLRRSMEKGFAPALMQWQWKHTSILENQKYQ